MYLIPSAPSVFNRKWDSEHTRYAPGQLPVTTASAVQAGRAAARISYAKIPYPRTSSISFTPPIDTSACMGCNCSSRGIGVPPQKRMGQLGQSAAGVPAGSVLAYSASWGNDFASWNDPNAIQSRIQGVLASKWGIIIDQQQHSTSDLINFSGKSGFVLQVHTNSDYGQPTDVQSIIDGEIANATGTMPKSTIRMVQSVAPGARIDTTIPASTAAAIVAAQAGYQDALARGDQTAADQFAKQIAQLGGKDPRGPMSWLSDNWQWLAAGGLAFIAAKELL